MIRVLALLLTVLTGFSGLVYEVAWQKVLATLLGSQSEATAAVLGLFLGGLALGYALFGRFTQHHLARAEAARRPPRLLFAYGFLEAGIGLFALCFPLFFRAIQALSFALPHGGAGLGFALDVGLSALLIGPPAILMGGTIPILTQALAHDLEDATRVHALVYAFNTVGAFAGALAAGFWIVPALGLVGTILAMGLINLFAGSMFLVLGRRAEPGAAARAPATALPARVPDFAACAAAALLVGFAMMTVQTALIRLGALSFGASQFTFSMVVAVFVLCIALGSLAVSALPRVPRGLLAGDLWALFLACLLLYPQLPDAPYWAHLLRVRFPQEPAAFYPYHLSAFGGVLLVIGLPVAFSGAALPLLFDHLRNRVGELGGMAGRLYSWNTVGSLLGALLGGYALLFWLDLHHLFRLALFALASAAVLLTQRTLLPGRRPLVAAALLAALLGIVLLPAWPPQRLSSGLFRERSPLPDTFEGPEALFESRQHEFRVRFYEDDPTASIAVIEVDTEDGRVDHSLWTNGKSDGAVIGDYPTMALTALVPALFAERAERAFVIGYGTGVTAGALASLHSMREITLAEISPAVIRAAPIFEEGNGHLLSFPGLRIIQSDAYRALMRSDERFDLIVSSPSNPWVTGIEMLYSREFFEAAREHLAPGGAHCQWVPAYETDGQTVATVLRAYAAVFEHVAVWYGRGPDLLLLGLSDPEQALDLDRVAARLRRPDYAAAFERADIRSLPALLAHELLPLGVLHALSLEAEEHTLLHPRLGHLAARAFFVGGIARLPITAQAEVARLGDRNSLLARYVARRGGRLPAQEHTQLVDETCAHRPRECLTLLAQWKHDTPHSPARARLEAAIRSNPVVAQQMDLALVEPLSQLYDERGVAEPEGADPLQQAQQATQLFASYYHHGAPFSRQALARLWQRCLATEPESCGSAIAEAAPTLAALGVMSPAPGGA